jgi:hypothetical protein
MEITRGKILGLVVALAFVVVNIAYGVGFLPKIFKGCPVLFPISLLSLALIWFPDLLGSAKGPIGHGQVDKETPQFLVSFMGWLFLIVGGPLIAFLMR